MARKATRKVTNAERQAKLKEKMEAGELPEGVEVVVLEPTREGLQLMERAIAEVVGEKVVEFEPEEELERQAIEELDAALPELDEEEEKKIVSVVKDKFKKRYIDNAVAVGATHKAAKRSNWDWLAQEIAKFCLDDKGKIDIRAFVALLNVNGVDHSRWVNRNRGWEGRFRMTGRVALQKIVATQGFLRLPDDLSVNAPQEWRDRFLPKT